MDRNRAGAELGRGMPTTKAHDLANGIAHADQPVYDAVAEWQASRRPTRVLADTVKLLKDRLLRVSFDLEQNATEDVAAS